MNVNKIESTFPHFNHMNDLICDRLKNISKLQDSIALTLFMMGLLWGYSQIQVGVAWGGVKKAHSSLKFVAHILK